MPERLMGAVALVMLTVSLVANSRAQHVPEYVTRKISGAELVGHAQMDYLFWDVYQAYLYAPRGEWRSQPPYALSLHYQRSFSAGSIADKTIELMRGQSGKIPARLLEKWRRQMVEVFPDVQKGSVITGIYLPQGRSLFYGKDGRFLGEISGKRFGERFFAIWLGPETPEPALRKKLIGKTP